MNTNCFHLTWSQWMHSSIKERVIFQMTGGSCILFASQFCKPPLLPQGHQTNHKVMPQAAQQQREAAELTARPEQYSCGSRAGAWKAAHCSGFFCFGELKSKDVQPAGWRPKDIWGIIKYDPHLPFFCLQQGRGVRLFNCRSFYWL